MKTINVTVRDKIASAVGDIVYICGNSDYVINFDFDAEWDAHDVKTARFVHDGSYIDIVFTGNQCDMPVIHKAYGIYVGVYAGDLRTTTPAHIPSAASILSADGTPEEPPDDVYAQITALCEDALATANSVRDDADAGKFNGAPGKTPVAGVDYFTEADKQAIAADAAEAVGFPQPTSADTGKSLRVVGGEAKWEGALSGTTDELTPTQVYEAVKAGRPVVVTYTDQFFGELKYTSFSISETMNVIAANTIAFFNKLYVLGVLFGDKSSNTWGFKFTSLAEADNIPSILPNPNPLTLKLGNESVSYDGSEAKTVDVVAAVGFPQPTASENGKFLGCENGKAKWLPVELSGGGDISLGLTAASVGQTIKVKAVDENGKPTEWEAADLISGGDKWELLNSIEISETVNTITISADKDGSPLTLKRAVVVCELNRDMDDPFTFIKMKANGLTVCNNQQENSTSQKVYLCYFFEIVPGFGIFVDTHLSRFNYNWGFSRQKMGYKDNDDYKQKSINSIKLEANDGNKNVCASGKIDVFGVRA